MVMCYSMNAGSAVGAEAHSNPSFCKIICFNFWQGCKNVARGQNQEQPGGIFTTGFYLLLFVEYISFCLLVD